VAWGIIVVLTAVFLYAWSESTIGGAEGYDMATDLERRIAEAIGWAEGIFHPSGTAVPQRANNPGNLKLGDIGFGTIGGKTIYQTIEEGWTALIYQIDLILTGRSRYYTPDMTIRQVAVTYTGGDNADAWANIVSGKLGVTPDTKIGEVV